MFENPSEETMLESSQKKQLYEKIKPLHEEVTINEW